MASTPRIYIGSYDVALGIAAGEEHLYLLYDPDVDGDGDPTTSISTDPSSFSRIIRGGPETGISSGQVLVEIRNEQSSSDSFGGDTPTDRNFRLIDEGSHVSTLWSQMETFAESMGSSVGNGNYETSHDYKLVGPNSNSVINTTLNAAGINLRNATPLIEGQSGPPYQSPYEFPGHMSILDGSGNDSFTAFAYNNRLYTFFNTGGNDTITVEEGAYIKILPSTVSGANTLILKGFDPNSIELIQHWDDLIIKTKNTQFENGERVAYIADHFASINPNTTLLQFQDASGNHFPSNDINLAGLDSQDLVAYHLLTPSYFNSNPVGAASAIWDPLIVDLDGDGVLTDMNGGFSDLRHFDLNNDGFAEAMRWAGEDDGWLVRDLNSNGRIDNGGEMFGTADIDGFTALAAFDSNSDGLINSSDTIWSDLLIWKDENADAQTQSGELHALSIYDIVSIDVTNVTETDITFGQHGDDLTHSGVANTLTGTLEVVNATFFTDATSTRYAGDYDLDPLAAVLPDIIGRGTIADMHIAMSLDNDTSNSNSLISIMQDLASYSALEILTDYSAFKQKVVDLSYRWAGVEGNSVTGRGPNLEDGRILDFLEKYYGAEFSDPTTNSSNPEALQAIELVDGWTNLLGKHMTKIILQGSGEAIFGASLTNDFLKHEVQGTEIVLEQSFIDDLEAHAAGLADTASRKAFWLSVADFINLVEYGMNYTNNEYTEFSSALSTTTESALNAAVTNSDSSLAWKSENHTSIVEAIEYRFFNPTGEVIQGDANVNDYTVDTLFRRNVI